MVAIYPLEVRCAEVTPAQYGEVVVDIVGHGGRVVALTKWNLRFLPVVF